MQGKLHIPTDAVGITKNALQRMPLCWASQKDALAAVTSYFSLVPNLPYNDSGQGGFGGP